MTSVKMTNQGIDEAQYEAAVTKMAKQLTRHGVEDAEHAARETMAMYRHHFRIWN